VQSFDQLTNFLVEKLVFDKFDLVAIRNAGFNYVTQDTGKRTQLSCLGVPA